LGDELLQIEMAKLDCLENYTGERLRVVHQAREDAGATLGRFVDKNGATSYLLGSASPNNSPSSS